MNDVEYMQTQENLVLVARMVAGLDLDVFMRRIEQAEAIGPLIDPTLYRGASGKLAQVKALAESAMPLWSEARKQIAKAEEPGQ